MKKLIVIIMNRDIKMNFLSKICIRLFMIIHFGINPRSGGIPLNLIIKIKMDMEFDFVLK